MKRFRAFAVLAAVVGLTAAGPCAEAAPALFGTSEVARTNLKPFPKWTGALEKYFAEKKKTDGSCESTDFNACHYRQWAEFIAGLEGMDLNKILTEVNRFMNRRKYIVDPVNWGVKDYWESPSEFFSRFGDCEDYAIAKYLTLRRLGIPPERMRIVILKDLNLKVLHAVLAVYLDGGRIAILDNQLSIVVDSKRIRHYRPIYSVNENGWWKHKARRAK